MIPGKLQEKDGFTLLEVIIAFVILATTVAIILQLFSSNLRLVATSENYVWAVARIDEIMRQTLDRDDLKVGTTSETLPDGYITETTVSRVYETRTRDLPIEVLEIAVRLSFQGGRSGEKYMTVRSMKMVKKQLPGRM